ncbi:CDP_diacylglycerol insitol_3_phosphatidyltransferase [Enterospora canceri]|uniref:CDP-diacylglycerol--inositol 3-phosphatidyltransferase n=1 Tax=Enterospora canceri TaxID=1081671 RepID=A0A1Y1S6H7_9MICR|nr:CDP_diacylglycerol insitol_3_phosphatidyltransferase [Enterospora canceri]
MNSFEIDYFFIHKMPRKSAKSKSTLLFLPNIIGLIRITAMLIAIYSTGVQFVLLYLFSVGLDFFDGKIARSLNQVSILGGVLDMVTDRVTTNVLCTKLASFGRLRHIQNHLILYIFLDVLGSMIYFISMSYLKTHHKQNSNLVLKFYYRPNILKICCSGSELYFVALYTHHSGLLLVPGPVRVTLWAITCFKTFVNMIHLYCGIRTLSVQK